MYRRLTRFPQPLDFYPRNVISYLIINENDSKLTIITLKITSKINLFYYLGANSRYLINNFVYTEVDRKCYPIVSLFETFVSTLFLSRSKIRWHRWLKHRSVSRRSLNYVLLSTLSVGRPYCPGRFRSLGLWSVPF